MPPHRDTRYRMDETPYPSGASLGVKPVPSSITVAVTPPPEVAVTSTPTAAAAACLTTLCTASETT
jgi:hypothetical protein